MIFLYVTAKVTIRYRILHFIYYPSAVDIKQLIRYLIESRAVPR